MKPLALMGAWQCPGCLTFYPLWISSCGCQNSQSFASGTTTTPFLGINSTDIPAFNTTQMPWRNTVNADANERQSGEFEFKPGNSLSVSHIFLTVGNKDIETLGLVEATRRAIKDQYGDDVSTRFVEGFLAVLKAQASQVGEI